MDGTLANLALFLIATFAAALVAALSGFAFGLVAAAIWLQTMTPVQAATLIIAYGLLVQGYAVWKLRRALQWDCVWPFLLGGAIGVPIGVTLLNFVSPAHLKMAVGLFLCAYSIYGLARPIVRPVASGGAPLDAMIGALNGLVAGATGLAGIVVAVWCNVRGWSKDTQRAVFQPVGVATFIMCAIGAGLQGAVTRDTTLLFVIGLPALLAGTWIGFKLYGRVDETGFRKIVLIVLLLAGVGLVV